MRLTYHVSTSGTGIADMKEISNVGEEWWQSAAEMLIQHGSESGQVAAHVIKEQLQERDR